MDRDQEIPFVYEHGVLRPEGKVDLPEGARGTAIIRDTASPRSAADSPARSRSLDTIRRIAKSGEFDSGGQKLSRDEMHERG